MINKASNTVDNIKKILESLGDELTLIIVAHRLSTLRNCNQVVELENGRIKRIGSYENIVNK